MRTHSLPLIAVDIGLLASDAGGLSRYVRELLPEVMRQSTGSCQWALYGRNSKQVSNEMLASARLRTDRLPVDLGRVFGLFSSLPWWARKDTPDVFWGPAHRLPTWLPGSTAKVVTVHDLCWLLAPETMRPVTRMLDSILMPLALERANRVIAVSNATQVALAHYYPQHQLKISVVREGASALPAAGPMKDLLDLGVRQEYVLFVGTREPRKNLVRLVEAFAQVADHKATRAAGADRPQLVLAGASGWGEEMLMTGIVRLGLTNDVLFLGRVSDRLLSTLYRHALCLAMPSLMEGFGLPLVEAMAQGTPVVTSNGSAMLEVTGLAGVLVDPLSVDSIAAGIERLTSNPDERSRLGLRAIEQAALFTWERAADETLKILLDACAGRQQ